MATKELSLLLFNVGHGPVPAAGNAVGITADQVAGIKAVLSSGTVQNAQHLFVLASDRGQCGGPKLAALKTKLGIQNDNDYICNGTVGIFPRNPPENFARSFLPITPQARAAFVKVTVPLNGGDVNILLVSYHGPHRDATLEIKKQAFLTLITTSDTMKREKRCQAVIIGGDFNLPMSDAKAKVKKANTQTELHYAPNAHFSSSLDFVVYWPNTYLRAKMHHPKMLKWTNEPFGKIPPTYPHVVPMPRPPGRMCLDVEPFDHPRLLYKFEVSRP